MPSFVAPMIGRGVALLTPTADGSANQVIKTNGSGVLSFTTVSGTVPVHVADGRLTTESGVPISTSDRASQSTLYYTPHIGNQIALYDGSSAWTLHTFTERSLALSGLTSGKNYDVFLYDNSGTLTLELSAAWTNDTTRADALTTQDGVYVKSGSTTRRYLGTIRTTATTTTEDSLSKRFVWNVQNRVHRRFFKEDSGSHTINNTSVREWNAGTNAPRCEFVVGLNGTSTAVHAGARMSGVSFNVFLYPALDGTSLSPWVNMNAQITCKIIGTGVAVPTLGYHYFTLREAEFASATATMDYGSVTGTLEC